MATHSSVLAWRIPGMGEPGGLLSMGSHRVGHNWSDLAAAAAAHQHTFRITALCNYLLKQIGKNKNYKQTFILLFIFTYVLYLLPWWLSGKESTCNAGNVGDIGSIHGLGKCSGGGNGNPLQYSCLENSIDRGNWWAVVHKVANSQTLMFFNSLYESKLLSSVF